MTTGVPDLGVRAGVVLEELPFTRGGNGAVMLTLVGLGEGLAMGFEGRYLIYRGSVCRMDAGHRSQYFILSFSSERKAG